MREEWEGVPLAMSPEQAPEAEPFSVTGAEVEGQIGGSLVDSEEGL